MNDITDNPIFDIHGPDLLLPDSHIIPPHQSIPTPHMHDPQDLNIDIPINPLAQQSSLVHKMDNLPSSLPHSSAAIFWKQATDHYQYYDEFFTSLRTLSTPWSGIPYQKSWLIYNATWQATLPNDTTCLGMLVVNAHANKGYWELLQMAPSVTPRFIFSTDSLLYKPSSTSPLVISPLN